MHFGEKPYEYCRKVLVLTFLFTTAEHRFSDTRQLRIVGLFSSIEGHVSRRMFTCWCPFWHAAGSTAVWVDGVSTRGLCWGWPSQCNVSHSPSAHCLLRHQQQAVCWGAVGCLSSVLGLQKPFFRAVGLVVESSRPIFPLIFSSCAYCLYLLCNVCNLFPATIHSLA